MGIPALNAFKWCQLAFGQEVHVKEARSGLKCLIRRVMESSA